MPNYKHFCYRANWLNLSQEETLYMERVFAMGRFLENAFITQYQTVKSEKIDQSLLTEKAIREVVEQLKETEVFQPYLHVHDAFVDSQITIIAEYWNRHFEKNADRPEFRKPQDDQIAWIFRKDAIQLYRDVFFIPGCPFQIPLRDPKIKLFGEPSCYYIHRETNGHYYLVVLYERVMPVIYIHNSDATIGKLGARLQNLCVLAEKTATQSDVQHIESEAYLIRKRVLLKLLAARTNASVEHAA